MRRTLPVLLALFVVSCGTTTQQSTLDHDGARVRTFRADVDTTFKAIVDVLLKENYQITRADELGQSISANSPVKTGAIGSRLDYTIARFDLESMVSGITNVRLGLTKTWEISGHGRTPNNDRLVGSESKYEYFFERIEQKLAE
jgi:hypothetical protein